MTGNGMTVAAARSGGVSSYVYDTANAEEVAITVGGGLGESDIGGPVTNLAPESGGHNGTRTTVSHQAGGRSGGGHTNRAPQAHDNHMRRTHHASPADVSL